MSGLSGKSQAARLAVADFRFEARVSLCLVLALAAVMTPLLVLFGLKSGMVHTLQQRLLADPRNLEVVVVGSQRLTADWLAALAKRPETGFSVARTRALSATVDARAADGRAFPGLEMVPSAAGDPLLPADVAPPAGRVALLSATAAARLGVRAGDTLTAQVTRTVNGETQAARFPLTVGGIVPETAFPRAAAFVSLDLLVETEDFRDGLAALGAAGAAQRTAPRLFAGVRLYARDLDAVAPLAGVLRGEGMEVRTRAAEIDSVRAIDRVLSLIVGVLVAIGASGFLLSLGASLWANVERKRRDLALMRLIGFSGAAAAMFPAVQALLVAAGGILLSGAVYLLVAWGFDAALGASLGENEFVCRLPVGDYLAAAAATLVAALAAASLAGRRAAKVDPAEGLRDV